MEMRLLTAFPNAILPADQPIALLLPILDPKWLQDLFFRELRKDPAQPRNESVSLDPSRELLVSLCT
jgi:hypothetical protein